MSQPARDSASISCTGSFRVPLEPERAIGLFTAEGERRWVPGWEPRYPEPEARDTDPGTVFLTRGEAGDVVWVVTAATGSGVRYARLDPRGIAGTVEVVCGAAGEGATTVEVTYQLTALEPAARAELGRFAAGYRDYLESWREAIDAAIERGAV